MRRMLFVNPNFLQFNNGQSTFRVGSKWADLHIGETIELAHKDGETETPVGTAAVVGIVTGPYRMLLERHARTNHESAGAGPFADEELDEIMQKVYGGVGHDDPATVVYLNRLT